MANKIFLMFLKKVLCSPKLHLFNNQTYSELAIYIYIYIYIYCEILLQFKIAVFFILIYRYK